MRAIIRLAMPAILVILLLATTAGAEPLDHQAISFRKLTPGVSTLDDVVRELGSPTLNRADKVLVYGPDSIMVQFDRQKKIIGLYLMMTPKVDIITAMSPYKELANGNPELVNRYGALFPFDRTKDLPNARITRPRGFTLVWVPSAGGRSIGFVYQGEARTLCQIALVNF